MINADKLSPAEMRALGAADQIGALNDLFGEIKRLGDLKQSAIDAHADARMKAISDPSPTNKVLVIAAKRDVDKVGAAIAARKEQTKILQTLLRSIPA